MNISRRKAIEVYCGGSDSKKQIRASLKKADVVKGSGEENGAE
ncbi:hypothetical protein OS31_17880 [Dickeya oryzae]